MADLPKGLTEKAQTLHRTYEILVDEPAEISFYTAGVGEWEATITSDLVDVTERGETAEEVEEKVLDRAITDLKQLIDPNGLGVTITDALKWGEEFEMLTRTETRHSNAEWELVHAKDHQAALACALNYNADTALFKDKVHMLRHGEEGEASFTAYFVSLPIKDEEGREYDGQVWLCVNSWEIFPIAKPLCADNLEQATFQFNLFIQKSEECYA